jgi:hypothetical protein
MRMRVRSALKGRCMPMSDAPSLHVSITALRVDNPLRLPAFWWHTFRSIRQARTAPGNLLVAMRFMNGAYHTLTVWENRAAMVHFMRSGAHRRAMADLPSTSMGRVAGFAAERAPDWADVPALLGIRGRDV